MKDKLTAKDVGEGLAGLAIFGAVILWSLLPMAIIAAFVVLFLKACK